MNKEQFFSKYRDNIIGIDCKIDTPYENNKRVIYADWTASGRCYKPIEDLLVNKFMPYVANTHTDTNTTGAGMTYAYHKAREIIKKHVNASDDDVLICAGSGMTGVVNKFQRILGLRLHEKYKKLITIPENERPIVFVSHMEHHSNQTSWLETIADLEIINHNEKGLVDLEHFELLLDKYKNRQIKIAAITSCSNVTGIFTPYHDIAKMIHNVGGYCFVDFACSAPYIDINMHPADKDEYLDAIYFSPHKFLGGPGSTGVLIFNKSLYHNTVPDNPGGGTVEWTNPWKNHRYIDDIEIREDGGTPAFLQAIRIALCIKLKDEIGVKNIYEREQEILSIIWDMLLGVENIHILAANNRERLPIISFYIDKLHYNLGVKILNDRFGIQTRGGCSCAGTYGHYLLNVDPSHSNAITCMIDVGDYSEKPGWIRASFHPTMTDEEVRYICNSIIELSKNFEEWSEDYNFEKTKCVIKNSSCEDNFIISYIDNIFEEKL